MAVIAVLTDPERVSLTLDKGVLEIVKEKDKRVSERSGPYVHRCLCREEDEDAMIRSIFLGVGEP
jgi:hypothetical protein